MKGTCGGIAATAALTATSKKTAIIVPVSKTIYDRTDASLTPALPIYTAIMGFPNQSAGSLTLSHIIWD